MTLPPTPGPVITPTASPAPVGQIQSIPRGLVYLGDKATLALGFNMSAGGAIGSLLFQGRELVDRTDYGRYIQLSFYDGNQSYGPLGDDPYGKWGWNPIQAGSKAGGGSIVGAEVLEYRAADGVAYIKALGKEWGKYDQDSDVVFETWAWQRDGYFEVRTRATHIGDDSHGLATQEFPAAYFATSLTRMFGYFGEAPFTGAPLAELDHVARQGEIAGMGNCPRVAPTENWAAFADAQRFGLILALPPQADLQPDWNICLLYDRPPVGYIGPMAYFDVPAQAVREITYYLIPGPIETGRGIVYDLLPHTAWTFDLNSFEGWRGASEQDAVQEGKLTAHLSPGHFLTSRAGLNVSGAIAPSVSVNARAKDSKVNLCLHFVTTGDQGWDGEKSSCTTVSPGEFQKQVFDFEAHPDWKESVVTQLGLAASGPGVVEIDSITMEIQGKAWEFETEGGAEGWMAWNQLAEFQAIQSGLSARSTGDDPYMGSPTIALYAEAFPVIQIRMAVSSGSAAQLFFITSSDGVYDEPKSLAFPIYADGKFHTYTLDMSTVSGWNGTITQIRLDPTAAKSDILVDYVRIVKK